TNLYSFHAMFRIVLDKEFRIRGMNANELYESQGDWCLISGDRLGAISAYTECRDFERILNIMSERQASFLMNVAPRVLTKAFGKMPLDVRLSNPIGYLTYIYSYSNIIDIKKGAEMLAEAKEYYQSVRNLDDRNQIFGEIALIESLTAFNDIQKMFQCYDRANEYFDGGTSRIFNSSVSITFGIPLTMFLYHKEPGGMKALVELVEEELWMYTHIANGSGTGYELLIRAEYEYMTGNFEQAEMIAYKAIYKAKMRDQGGIVMSASFLLLRMALFAGKTREVDEILLQMMQEVEKENNPAMRGCYEFVLGYVYGYMGKTNLIPQWLKDINMNKGKLMAPARHSGYLIAGKVISETHDYKRLETFADELIELFSEKRNLIGIMIANVYKAIALYHNTGMESAIVPMKEALALSEPDGCYVTLAENSYEIISILEEIGTPYALKVRDMAKAYTASKAAYRNRKKEISLTKREVEVMDFVCDGYTAEAISKMIYVSHSTVKKHIKAAYEKLGVNKKADAIAEYKKLTGK
ncbi:MAG: helix-turn-helix transcriptional regulator, partial [Firmicutes bacterium]|nr:helix-turn-helix transcriptional regulator [Bacillota bacterium]